MSVCERQWTSSCIKLTILQQSLILSVRVATVEMRNPLQLNLVQSEQPSAAANCGFDKTEHKKTQNHCWSKSI